MDLYKINDTEIKFGEMTFTSASGASKWAPEGTDLMLGNLIKLNK